MFLKVIVKPCGEAGYRIRPHKSEIPAQFIYNLNLTSIMLMKLSIAQLLSWDLPSLRYLKDLITNFSFLKIEKKKRKTEAEF